MISVKLSMSDMRNIGDYLTSSRCNNVWTVCNLHHELIETDRWLTCFYVWINSLRPKQNGRHFADILKRIFLNENIWIPIRISLNFVPKCSMNNIPALFQIMAWRRPGDKPLSEPIMVNLPAHICVTRPQWVLTNEPNTPTMQALPLS